MANDIFEYSVPAFLRGHKVLGDILRAGEKHADERKIAPSVLLGARLFPDMFPLTGQVRAACDTAIRTTARLVGKEPPQSEDADTTFAALYGRIRKASEFVEGHRADAFAGAENRTVAFKMGPAEISWSTREYLTRFSLPNFYFHVTTAYDILRHNGVVLGKRNYLGDLS